MSKKVFLCHSSGDKEDVRRLYWQLCADSIDAWFDEEDLLPGQDWELEIAKAVRSSAVVVVCLSPTAIAKTGYVQKEIAYALDIALQQPEGQIFIIPARLEECVVPDRLRKWQWVDIFEPRDYERLFKALLARDAVIMRKAPETSSTAARSFSATSDDWKPDNSRVPLGYDVEGHDGTEMRELPLIVAVLVDCLIEMGSGML